MPALRMKRRFNDDLGNEFDACSNSTKSFRTLHSQVSEFEQSVVLTSSYENPQDETDLTTQLAGQDIRIMKDADFGDVFKGTSYTLLKDLISEVTSSPILESVFLPYYEDINSQLNLVNYVSEEGNGNLEASALIALNNHETSWLSGWNCSLLDIFPPEEALLLDTSTGLLTNYATLCDEFAPMDTLLNTSGRYDAFPFNEKTAGASIAYYNGTASFGTNMCFSNYEVSQWLNKHLAEEDLPGLVDFTDSLPQAQESIRNVTLVLDLDETLIHSTLEHCDDADFSFPVFVDTKERTVYVRKRPNLDTFLQKVAQMFEIVIFTASQSFYANQVLDKLDPEKRLISLRFFRESCTFANGSHTKNLTTVQTDLAKVAIIDNSPQVFQLQVNNGIPIESWINDPSDHALLDLVPFLETLAIADDVRPIIAKKFGNKD